MELYEYVYYHYNKSGDRVLVVFDFDKSMDEIDRDASIRSEFLDCANSAYYDEYGVEVPEDIEVFWDYA